MFVLKSEIPFFIGTLFEPPSPPTLLNCWAIVPRVILYKGNCSKILKKIIWDRERKEAQFCLADTSFQNFLLTCFELIQRLKLMSTQKQEEVKFYARIPNEIIMLNWYQFNCTVQKVRLYWYLFDISCRPIRFDAWYELSFSIWYQLSHMSFRRTFNVDLL